MGLSKLRNGNCSTLSMNPGFAEKEYFWACDLSSENKCHKWKVSSDDLEDDDEDYIEHGLVIRSVCLGPGAVEKEENIVVMESIGEDGKIVQGTIANLTKGLNPMTSDLSLTVNGKGGATFTLVNGSGPLSICGSHLLDFPEDDDMDGSQTDDSRLNDLTGTEDGEEEDGDEEEEEDEEEESVEMESNTKTKGIATKRKAPASKPNKRQKQKAKMSFEEDEEDDEDDEDFDEDDSESDAEDMAEEIMAKKNKKGSNGKPASKPKAKPMPTTTKNDKKGSAKKGKK